MTGEQVRQEEELSMNRSYIPCYVSERESEPKTKVLRG
jgi:hypothetical protein